MFKKRQKGQKGALLFGMKHIINFNILFLKLSALCLAISSILTFIWGIKELTSFPQNESIPKISEILEINLVGVILFICALKVCFLFWRDRSISIGSYFDGVNQSKEMLIGVIISTLGVTFIKYTLDLKLENPIEVLMFGLVISVVVIAFTFYSKVLSNHK